VFLGHAVAALGIGFQVWAVIGFESAGWGNILAIAWPLGVAAVFWQLWQTAEGIPWSTWSGLESQRHLSVLRELRQPGVRRLRSTYEGKIREAAGQEERHRLARDLHDSIKQQIFVMHTAAATAQARFDSDPAGARAAIDQVRGAAREAAAEMEAMLDQLRASPLENSGLIDGLKKQCEALRFRTGADVRLVVKDLPPSETMPVGAQQVLFRVAQEALANVGRHARAKQVTVTLESTPISVQLRVDDDGVGFDAAQPPIGMGLGNMRSRAEALGGTFALTSEPGKGTLVRASVPHAPNDGISLALARRRVLVWSGVWLFVAGQLVLVSTFLRYSRGDVVGWSLILIVHTAILARVTAAYLRMRKSAGTAPGSGAAA